MNKKWGLSVFACAALLAGCNMAGGASEGSPNEVTLWAGGSDNVRQAMSEIQTAFNDSEYGEDYSLNVEFVLSGAGAQSVQDRLLAAYEAGEENTDFDMVLLSDAEYASYISESDENLFDPIDFSKVPNAENLISSVAVGEEYLLPYRGTTVVLAYNSDVVQTPPQTSEELYQWIKDHPGRFSYNSPGSGGAGSSFVATSVYNFLPEEALTSDDPEWKTEWDQGFDLLEELHPYLYQTGGQTIYPNTNQGTLDLLAAQEVDMIPAWADMSIQQLGEGTLPESIKITQIDPAFTGNVDALSMPSIGQASDEARHAVMDFMVSKEVQEILLDQMAAIPLIDSSDFDSNNKTLLEGLDISKFRVTSTGTLGTELTERWDEEIAPLD
ncbi:extracellular solute-binding protein [Marinilactibacillus sp. GCM10026970]|uniref:extracellular solute-binding protein n=1 Tax=Marinilactibacillus sp. GCM10026970 TaxID=3252642 RepID=UPI003619A93D